MPESRRAHTSGSASAEHHGADESASRRHRKRNVTLQRRWKPVQIEWLGKCAHTDDGRIVLENHDIGGV